MMTGHDSVQVAPPKLMRSAPLNGVWSHHPFTPVVTLAGHVGSAAACDNEVVLFATAVAVMATGIPVSARLTCATSPDLGL
jgi:hypothetical protein